MTIIEQRTMMHIPPSKRPKLINYVACQNVDVEKKIKEEHPSITDVDQNARDLQNKVRANFAAVASLMFCSNNVTSGADYRPAVWSKALRLQIRVACAFFDTVDYSTGHWNARTAHDTALDWS